MFAFPKFIPSGLIFGGRKHGGEANIRDIYWVSYLGGVYFLLGGGVYTGGVFKGFYDLRIKD